MTTPRAQLTEDEIEGMRKALLEGSTIKELARKYRRSATTIRRHSADLMDEPEMPPLDIAPDAPDAKRWEDRAACRWTDTEVFFAADEIGQRWAKRICGQCPLDVRSECLRYALETGSEGVWGMTTDEERKRLRGAA